MEPNIVSISSSSSNIRQDVFPLGQWTITTRKGIIMQSKCTCQQGTNLSSSSSITKIPAVITSQNRSPTSASSSETNHIPDNDELCSICKYYKLLPQLHSMPDMLFNNNILKLEHFTGVGLEFNALDALKLVEETKDPLKVAVADGWQSARADCAFAKSVVKPFDWTFTTNYRGSLLSAIRKHKRKYSPHSDRVGSMARSNENQPDTSMPQAANTDHTETVNQQEQSEEIDDRLSLTIEETEERIDVNKLKVREEILFYDDVTLYEDELADHGTAQYSVKVRVMPKSLFILARFYLRIDGVLARINDTRIYHELNKKYLLREFTNREAKLNTLNLPVSTLVNANELSPHLPIIHSSYERLCLPKFN